MVMELEDVERLDEASRKAWEEIARVDELLLRRREQLKARLSKKQLQEIGIVEGPTNPSNDSDVLSYFDRAIYEKVDDRIYNRLEARKSRLLTGIGNRSIKAYALELNHQRIPIGRFYAAAISA